MVNDVLEEVQRNIDDIQHGEFGPKVENEDLTVRENEVEQVENGRYGQGRDRVHYEKLQVHADHELSEEEQELLVGVEEILKRERIRLPSLRSINKSNLKSSSG